MDEKTGDTCTMQEKEIQNLISTSARSWFSTTVHNLPLKEKQIFFPEEITRRSKFCRCPIMQCRTVETPNRPNVETCVRKSFCSTQLRHSVQFSQTFSSQA